jgi:predicted nucleic acid-binding protein
MPYLFDSDIVIDLLDGVPQIRIAVDSLMPGGAGLSIVTYMEVRHGILARGNSLAAQSALEAFIQAAPILPFSRTVADRCAELRVGLQQQGRSVRRRALDLIVAATALHYDFTLVTRNLADYRDIPGLKVLTPEDRSET